ncbi:hypothetical protein GOHSU_40_00470 [Gordonia hirsuta DSM 44140 = NBRC 16056]|uniref:Uncharacterized protein n=1 Tax=Gordonia hirsuta DSM 44140 = NBRC 16056 TaxID=1121927 RepID=L7LEK8_9ACTN|nr:hypothetical protein [Gordonia hirsuta]GAC58463.1 hypothetical protein GOHSU_40_00470 [Gordonia hirsuta DSM 44140 = NBRC 16056]
MAGTPPPRTRVAPERRTRLDLAVTAAIVVLVVVAGVLLWWTAPARSTELTTADEEPSAPLPTESLPTELHELWRAPSPATAVPAVARATVLTGHEGTMTGRDPQTGQPLWRYTRTAPLCALAAAWPGGENDALGVYRNRRGCSEVTALNAGTGARKGNRTSDADSRIALSYDRSYALAAGDTRLETWGTNLVRGIEYGRIEAPVNPETAPDRHDCTLHSAISGADRVAVVERCSGDTGYRLTVLSSTMTSEEKIRQWGSELITESTAAAPPAVISVTDTTVTVYDGGGDPGSGHPGPTVRMFGHDALQRAARSVSGEVTPPPGSRPLTASGLTTYWTGRSTLVLDANSGQARVRIEDTIGPGEVATALMIPVPGAISLRDPVSGEELRKLPVDRGDYRGLVSLSVLGPYVIEQRGDQIVVLGPRG